MKKISVMLALVLLLAACSRQIPPDVPADTTAAPIPETGSTEVTTTVAPPAETTAPPAETTAPPAETTAPPTETTAPDHDSSWDGKLPTPMLGDVVLHPELVWMHTWQEYSDGQGAMLTGDGALMFYSTSNYLPQIADKIPTVGWSETLALTVGEKNGLTHTGGTTVSVYGEDCAELVKHISMDELITRSRNEWKGKTVYLEFGVTFRHAYSAEIEEAFSYCYFAKTTFAA